MILLNFVLFALVLLCIYLSEGSERIIIIPQAMSLIIILNKETILTKIGNYPKEKFRNVPIFNDDKTAVSLQLELIPKGRLSMNLDNFQINGAYIDEMSTSGKPNQSRIGDPAQFSFSLDEPKIINMKIRAYKGKTLPRFLTLSYNYNGRTRSKTFFVREPN